MSLVCFVCKIWTSLDDFIRFSSSSPVWFWLNMIVDVLHSWHRCGVPTINGNDLVGRELFLNVFLAPGSEFVHFPCSIYSRSL